MKIIAAPNAFKGSLSALKAAHAIRRGATRVFPEAQVIELPIADGGDGTLDVVVTAANGHFVEVEVVNPLGVPTKARFGILNEGKTAVVEMAAASGLRLLRREQLNPMLTTTYGTGQLIKSALDHGCEQIIIGVGGSATVEGGIGMAQALGARLLDQNGQQVGYGGNGLRVIQRIDVSLLDPRFREIEIIVASDVENPLIGREGAAAVFGPQKGATPEMVRVLDDALSHYSEIIRRDLGKDIAQVPGAGAAGGLGAGLVAFLDAEIKSGADVVMQLLDMEAHLVGASLLITGEGKIDSQTAYGKGPMAVAKLAKKQGVPVIALAGSLGDDADIVLNHGIDGLMTITSAPITLEAAMQNADSLIEAATIRALTLVRLGTKLNM